jgi:hypothetical protein
VRVDRERHLGPSILGAREGVRSNFNQRLTVPETIRCTAPKTLPPFAPARSADTPQHAVRSRTKPGPQPGAGQPNGAGLPTGAAQWGRAAPPGPPHQSHIGAPGFEGGWHLLPVPVCPNELTDELIGLKVKVILAISVPAAVAAKKATTTIPIVFIASDPVGSWPVWPGRARIRQLMTESI